MKKMVNVLVAVILAAIAAFSLGCNVQNTSKKDNAVEVETNENAEIQLTVGTLSDQSEKNLMATWINAFQRLHKNVNIELKKEYTTMEALPAYKTSGDMPDILWTAGDQHALYSQGNYFYDLSDETKFAGSEAFFATMYEAVVETTKSHADDTAKWFVPRDYNRLTVFYNKTVFEQMDIALPQDGWTMKQFLATCEQLMTEKNGVKCAKAISWPDWAPMHSTLMRNYGASYLDEDGVCAIDSEATRAAYEWYKNFYNSSVVSEIDGSNFGRYRLGAKEVSSGMFVSTYARLGTVMESAKLNGWQLGTVAFPDFSGQGEGYTGVGCSGYAISTTCTDEAKRNWAWEFLKWCMSRDGYDTVAEVGVVCPAIRSMRNDGEWTKYGKDMINYHAFVDDHTYDMGLNYQNVLPKATTQDLLIKFAQDFWKNAGSVSYEDAVRKFESSFSALG